VRLARPSAAAVATICSSPSCSLPSSPWATGTCATDRWVGGDERERERERKKKRERERERERERKRE
jgi:hypothetical protein